MNSEMLGVSFLKLAIAKTDYLVAHINENDKEPSWDGDVEVYQCAGNTHKKSDLMLKVPIQVKGMVSSNLTKGSISYPVEISDLNNYLQVGGTMFFVVCVDESGESSHIYYAQFLPFDLKRMLLKHGGQKTKNVNMKSFPSNKFDIANLFINFVRDMKKQRPAITSDIVDIEDIVRSGQMPEMTFGYSSVALRADSRPFDPLFNNSFYVYAKLPYGIELPIKHMERLDEVKTRIPATISVDGQKFYDEYEVIYTADKTEMHFGRSSKITVWSDGDEQFYFERNGTLTQQIIDLRFILAALKAKSFEVNGKSYPLDDIEPEELSKFDAPFQEKYLEWLLRVKELMDRLRVKEELDYSRLTEQDVKTLHLLVTALLDGEPLELNLTPAAVGKTTIANIKILLMVVKNNKEENLYTVYGFNDAPIDVQAGGEDDNRSPSSVYVLLKKDDMLSCCNIDYDEMIVQLKRVPFSELFSSQLVALNLELLLAYDESNGGDDVILSAAIDMSEWLMREDPYTHIDILKLNYYQSIRRKRSLTKDEKQVLYKIIEEAPEKEEIYLGAYLVLGDYDAAQMHYENMDDSAKEVFQKYPIYNLWPLSSEK